MGGPTATHNAWAANLVSFFMGPSSFHLLFPQNYPGLPRELGGHWSNSTSNARALQKHLWLGAFMRTKCPLRAETAMGARSWEGGNVFLQRGSCSSSGQTRSLPRIHAWQAEHRRMESHPTPCGPGDSSQLAGSDPCRGHLAGAEMTWGTSLLTAAEMPVQPLPPIFPPFLLAPSFSVVLSGQNGIGS